MLICDELVKKYYSCTAVDHVNMRLDDGKVYAMFDLTEAARQHL